MGTALASFVAGALIVLTMFDETQVTKVDKILGSVKELHSKVQLWKGDQGLTGTGAVVHGNIKTQCSEALEESKSYVIYLKKESAKEKDETNPNLTAYPEERKNLLLSVLTTTKATVSNLELLQTRLGKLEPQSQDPLIKAIAEEAIPLTLQTKLEKARMNSFELLSHLQDKSLEPRTLKNKKSKAHLNELIQDISGINDRLANMNTTSSLDVLDKELGAVENGIVPLKKQTPYTLLMMRVVEIGLPLLLSIFSIFFVLRYSLTEKRSFEIKDLLNQRNAVRLKENGAAPATEGV